MPLRVLLVEDHDDTRAVMSRAIRHHGHEVVAVATVSDALRACSGGPFDVAVCDVTLRDGHGPDLVRQMKGPGFRRAVAVTGHGYADQIEGFIEAGFDRVLLKPLRPEVLLAAVAEVVAEASPPAVRDGAPDAAGPGTGGPAGGGR